MVAVYNSVKSSQFFNACEMWMETVYQKGGEKLKMVILKQILELTDDF